MKPAPKTASQTAHHVTTAPKTTRHPIAPESMTINEADYQDNPYWKEYAGRQKKYQ